MKEVFETVLPDDKGLIETLNDFYDGAINEADLTDIIRIFKTKTRQKLKKSFSSTDFRFSVEYKHIKHLYV